jgi:cyclophilin family peptidyl-prolyl cis-trans isomerase
MNYSLDDLPDAGRYPVIFFDIDVAQKYIGRLVFRLDRDVFPAGVENLVRIAEGDTHRVVLDPKIRIPGEKIIRGSSTIVKQIRRTFVGCQFFKVLHNNYLVSGDIYFNNGTSSGTVYQDKPIPSLFSDYYYPHEKFGQISLVPYVGDNEELFYDSTFMITLDDKKSTNVLGELDADQIVVGILIEGHDILRRINDGIRPFAGRTYPKYTISNAGTKSERNGRYYSKIPTKHLVRFVRPPQSLLVTESKVEDTSGSTEGLETGEITGCTTGCLAGRTGELGTLGDSDFGTFELGCDGGCGCNRLDTLE